MSDNIVEINGKKYKAGQWQIWNGGENPVPGKEVHWQVRRESRREAEENMSIHLSENLRWSKLDSSYDIVCYRVMEEVKPEVVEVVRWVNPDGYMDDGVTHSRKQRSESVAKITYNLVDGTPDPKSIKMTLV